MQERGCSAVPGRRGDGVLLGAGGQDALDRPVGRVTGGGGLRAGGFEPAGLVLVGQARTPWAARSRYRALSSSSPPISAVQAGPISAALFRHQDGVRIWNAIFSGG